MAQAQETLLTNITKEDILRLIIRHTFERARMPIFRKPPLRGETEWALLIGSIGDRGGGKSAMDAVLSIVDYMIYGKKCYSNMEIKCDIEVPDEVALEHGLNSGGLVHFESKPLEKDALLKLDERYYKAVIVIEEINVQYSNARRFMSNTNVDFNEVCQQLRKLETSLLYNVIDEMFVDSQLRSLTDIFVKTYDSALDVSNMYNRKPRGIDFVWRIYPMSGYLRGEQNKYAITHKPLDNAIFHFSRWQGIYNSMVHQEKGIYTMSRREQEKALKADISVQLSEDIQEHFNEWNWLYESISDLYQAGYKEIDQLELFDTLDIEPSKEVEADEYMVKAMRLKSCWRAGRKIYIFPDRVFDKERGKMLA